MKKKIVSIAMFAMIAVAAAWNVNENKNEVTISDLTLENVEALAEGESDYGKKIWERYYRSDGTGYNCSKTGNEAC